LLFLGSLVYTGVTVLYSRRETKARRVADPHLYADHVSPSVSQIVLDLLLILVGLGGLTLGARWLVDGAVAFAAWMGVSELIVGLTIVAVGTSLPEIATTIVAVVRGQRDIAVGNVVGSNLFNVLLVLGVCGIVAPGGLVVPPEAIQFDIPVMVVVAIACLPAFFFGHRITRWEGVLFLFYYAAYVTYLCLYSTENAALATFRQVMLWLVIPLTALTLIVCWYRLFVRERLSRADGSGLPEEKNPDDST
jgi:cation:H+ antiporter